MNRYQLVSVGLAITAVSIIVIFMAAPREAIALFGTLKRPITVTEGDYSMTKFDFTAICDAQNANVTITLPDANDADYSLYVVKRSDSSGYPNYDNLCKVEALGNQTIDRWDLPWLLGDGESILVQSDGQQWYELTGATMAHVTVVDNGSLTYNESRFE